MKRIYLFLLLPLGYLSLAGFWGCSTNVASTHGWIHNDSVPYAIPNVLVSESGKSIKTVKQWETIRRPELRELFDQQMYGVVPEGIGVKFRERYASPSYLNGKATLREFEMLVNNEPVPQMHVLLFIPNGAKGKVPVIIGYNWDGNHTQCTDTLIYMLSEEDVAKRTIPRRLESALEGLKRTARESRDIVKVIDNGYAYITACYWELEPDNNECFASGVRALVSKGQPLAGNAWGAIGAWAWGMSRMLDLAETIPEIDAARCAVVGHSRLGKTAILAGVRDPRIAIVTSNDSGCGGAALSKRMSGETVKAINERFPYWFCKNFHPYNDREEELPMDQHELLALVAPRPLYVCSGVNDLWADPLGEYLSVYYANPVYALYGKQPMPYPESTSLPPLNKPQIGDIAYHVENAGHAFSAYDWDQYLAFFDRYLK